MSEQCISINRGKKRKFGDTDLPKGIISDDCNDSKSVKNSIKKNQIEANTSNVSFYNFIFLMFIEYFKMSQAI